MLTCVIKVVQHLLFFPGWPARYRVWLTSTGITLIPVYVPTHLKVEADYLSQDWLLPEWHLLCQMAQTAFHAFGAFHGGGPSWHLLILLNASIITLWKLHYLLGTLGLNAFSHPWTFQASYVFPPPALVPLVLSTVSSRTCQWSTQTFDSGSAPCWMEAPWHSHNSHHVGRCSLVVSYCKRSLSWMFWPARCWRVCNICI